MLKHVDLEVESQGQLFTAAGSLKYLKELDLWAIYITETGAQALANALPSLQLLEKLVLGDTEASEYGKQVFTAIGSLRHLKELNFVCLR